MQNFGKVDHILCCLGVTENEKMVIYKYLAAILHFGNIQFENTDDGIHMTELSKKHVIIAAQLTNLFPDELEKAILFRLIKVPGSDVI